MSWTPTYATYRQGKVLARTRRLFTPQASTAGKPHALALENLKPAVVLEIVRRAGQEALRCLGHGWMPNTDLQVVPGNVQPLAIKLAGFRRIEVSVHPVSYLQQCAALHQNGMGPNSAGGFRKASKPVFRSMVAGPKRSGAATIAPSAQRVKAGELHLDRRRGRR